MSARERGKAAAQRLRDEVAAANPNGLVFYDEHRVAPELVEAAERAIVAWQISSRTPLARRMQHAGRLSLIEALAPFFGSPNPIFAAQAIEALDAADPEAAHGNADDILLANIHPEIAAAYIRLVERADWWAGA